jgi:methyl-accepting chemotaxis protein
MTASENGSNAPPQPMPAMRDGEIAPAESQVNAYAIDRLSQAFETSAKRWELIVYPSLFAFIILAAYGFYLIFSLAKDVHYLAISVDSNMTVLASNMQSMSDDMGQMTANVRTMTLGVESMARDVSTLEPMLSSMESMDRAIQSLNFSTAVMRDDVSGLNRNIGRPMHFMNSFMPW